MPLDHVNNDNYTANISIKHSDPAAAAVCEAAAIDTVSTKTSSSPPRDLNDDAFCDLSLQVNSAMPNANNVNKRPNRDANDQICGIVFLR